MRHKRSRNVAVRSVSDTIEPVTEPFEPTRQVVVPEETKLKSWAAANGVSGGPEEICADPKAAAYYLEQLTVTAKEGKLKGFELVKTLHLDAHQFTVEVRIGSGP